MPSVGITTTATSLCMGGSVTLTGTGATTYAWSGGITNAVPFTPAVTQTYTVTGTGGNGCTDTASIKITVNPLPVVVANSTATVICAGTNITLSASGALSYAWTGGATNAVPFAPASTQTYNLNRNGCEWMH